MCLAGIDNELAQMLRTPLPTAADSTSASPYAVKSTVETAVVGNPIDVMLLIHCSLITTTIVCALAWSLAILITELTK